MYYVIFESESLFRPYNYKNVKSFSTQEEAKKFADEKLKEGYPKVVVAQEISVYQRETANRAEE
ncbi:hypothetical protein [Aneurinibacillus terranovensis]|uniref:hypothetical protein n=1 Tax=Aneurinibacillus terranovensis TaxID=278991 RepID=UPI0004165B76|nr:hypothetical protein [Aneurinibacillus terranovensis]